MQDIVDSMRTRDIEIRPVKGDAFRLGFIAESPEVAMRVVERLVSLFIVQTSIDRATLAEGTDQFLETQLEDARRKLIDERDEAGGVPPPPQRRAADAARGERDAACTTPKCSCRCWPTP